MGCFRRRRESLERERTGSVEMPWWNVRFLTVRRNRKTGSSRRGERLQALGGGRLEWLLHRDGSHDPTATSDRRRKALEIGLYSQTSQNQSQEHRQALFLNQPQRFEQEIYSWKTPAKPGLHRRLGGHSAPLFSWQHRLSWSLFYILSEPGSPEGIFSSSSSTKSGDVLRITRVY